VKHKKTNLLFFRLAMILFVVGLIVGIGSFVQATDGSAEISTDKTKYSLGEPMVISGTGFTPDGAVTITVQQPGNNGIDSLSVTADASGNFVRSYIPPVIPGRYKITATDGTNTALTAATEADVSIGTYDQWANEDLDWINGSLGPSNSDYPEGDSTVQRLWLTGLTAGTEHTVTFLYQTTKAGKHAYDFLTKWDWSDPLTDTVLGDGIPGFSSATEYESTTIPHDPALPTNWEESQVPSASRVFTIRGGTFSSTSGPEITTPTLASGDYTGDSLTVITVRFTVNTDLPDGGGHGVVIYFGAHVANSLNWIVYDGTTGAGTISGNPYHVKLDQIDGAAAGNRDNQMKATGTFGTLIIVKDAIPDDEQDFDFTLEHDTITVPFQLDDDGNPTNTLPNSITFESIPTGLYKASELNIPAGWVLTDISCVDGDSTYEYHLGDGYVNITLAEGDTVTCTFTDVAIANPTITTVLSKSPVAIGESVYDTATLHDATADAGGTVSYNAFDDVD
jgi:hypothetical protein